ncbi:hypothetical protein [Actinomadura sp. 3N407]|uniref:hypothetical protein n=1 Tax=Actinomadura sp. 3N407 TaxID=3457423 RepID=UPI003FCE91B4
MTYVAALWLAVQTINICWPRETGDAWYIEWSMVLTLTVVGLAGTALYLGWARHRIAPAYGESERAEQAGQAGRAGHPGA